MVNVRMLALASALLLLLPLYAWAAPDPSDPTSLLVEGGAKQLLTVSNVTLVQPPQQRVVDPNSTYGHERLVEGHTVFAVIDLKSSPVADEGSIDISAMVNCTAETRVHYDRFLGVPIPDGVETTTLQCLENATLVAIPDPISTSDSASMSPLAPDGEVYRYVTPTGEVGYETEYSYEYRHADAGGHWRSETRYAWAVSPSKPWTDASGASKDVYVTLPTARLEQMGVRSFHVLDARALPMSR